VPNNWKKNVFFIVIFRGTSRGSFPSTINPLGYPVTGLCWGYPVTWAKKQTKSRNVENSVTAHKYKLCDKRVHQVPDINGFSIPVFQESAVRIESYRFLRPVQPPEYPPPLEKLTGEWLPLPLLPGINWSLSLKPLFAPGSIPGCHVSGSSSPRPLLPLAGKGGSGGIFAPCGPGGAR